MSRNQSPRRQLGVTLVETLLTLSIAGIVLGAGVPSFGRMLAEARVSAEAEALIGHFHLARTTAVDGGSATVLCPSADGLACASDALWHQGYLLFVDRNDNRAPDAGEPVLRHRPGAADAPVTATSSTYRRLVRFDVDGSAGGTNITITLCDQGGQVPPRAVIVSNLGRPRVSSKAPDGSALSCG
jgi:type IV fimbrial biogenesis protein FimT